MSGWFGRRDTVERMSKRALLVIDAQNEYFTGKLPVSHPQGHLANVLRAMDAATANGVPVVVVQHTSPQPDSPIFRRGTPEWDLHPEIARRPHELLVHKNLPGSFTGTELESFLRKHGVDTVVIAGYMTQMCCDTTSRQAKHLGMNVEFLSDATGTLGFTNEAGSASAEELHRATLVSQQILIAKVISTDEWLREISAKSQASAR
jgi:nicotinamidase-related amidase